MLFYDPILPMLFIPEPGSWDIQQEAGQPSAKPILEDDTPSSI